MKSSIGSVRRSSWRLAFLSLFVGLSPSSCKPKANANAKPSSTLAAASGERPACASFATQLCEKAGKDSPTCEAVTTTSGLMSSASCEAALKDVSFSLKLLAEQSKSCRVLTDKLCAAVGQKSQACAMVEMQAKGFDSSRCAEMLRNFDDVLSGLREAAAQNGPLNPAVAAQVASGREPAFGRAGAPVTIVVFSDFQCHFCAKSANALKGVVQRYGDRVSVVFRHFPLESHPDARLAAEAALAAEAQAKFVPMHDSLFEDQQHLDRAALETRASSLGLDMPRFKRALDRHDYAAVVDADLKLGELASVHATPTIFVNGTRVLDPTSESAMASAIDSVSGAPAAPTTPQALAQ